MYKVPPTDFSDTMHWRITYDVTYEGFRDFGGGKFEENLLSGRIMGSPSFDATYIVSLSEVCMIIRSMEILEDRTRLVIETLDTPVGKQIVKLIASNCIPHVRFVHCESNKVKDAGDMLGITSSDDVLPGFTVDSMPTPGIEIFNIEGFFDTARKALGTLNKQP